MCLVCFLFFLMFSKIFDDTLSLKSQFDKDLENSAKYLSSFILNQSISDIAGSFLSSPGKQIRSILYFKFFNMFKNKNIDFTIYLLKKTHGNFFKS